MKYFISILLSIITFCAITKLMLSCEETQNVYWLVQQWSKEDPEIKSMVKEAMEDDKLTMYEFLKIEIVHDRKQHPKYVKELKDAVR